MTTQNKAETILIRVDNDLKEESRKVLYSYGLTHSKGIRLFLDFLIENKNDQEKLANILKKPKK